MLRKKVVNKLMVNWVASFLSVVLLLVILAVPAMAYVAANKVVSSSIKDGSILNRDIRQNVISSSRIKNNTILNRDIHENVISSARIRDNAILNRDIKQNVISSSRIRNGTIQDADISGSAAISDSKINYSNKTGYLSISAAALRPGHYAAQYENSGHNLRIFNSAYKDYQAPVYLPHGATVTKLRYYFKDNAVTQDAYTRATLRRTSNYQEIKQMARTGRSEDSTSWQKLEASSINYAAINNRDYTYDVHVELRYASADLRAGNIVIEYTYTTPGG